MGEYLVGIYKEIDKKPDVVKIKNQKEYLEKLLDGEYLMQDYDDYTILYNKNELLLDDLMKKELPCNSYDKLKKVLLLARNKYGI